jgi:predicted RNA-binding Zn-ribbon protein involved in translation (DUF1610 family)
MAAILSSKGVKPDQVFHCPDCDTDYSGAEIINRDIDLFIVRADKSNPHNSVFRCHLCQEERIDAFADGIND